MEVVDGGLAGLTEDDFYTALMDGEDEGSGSKVAGKGGFDDDESSDDDMGAVGDDDDGTGTAAASSASVDRGMLGKSATRKPLRTQIEECKANVEKLQALKQSQMDEEDFMAAHETKERIKAEDKLLADLRRLLTGAATPARAKGNHKSAKRPGPRVSLSVGPRSSPVRPRNPSTFDGSIAAATAAATKEAKALAKAGAPENEDVDMHDSDAECERAEDRSGTEGTEKEDGCVAEGTAASVDWCDAEDPEFVRLADDTAEPPFELPRDTHERLYAYQRHGVAWMAHLWRNRQGGILADEMGLGKTVQVCALLHGARKAGAKHALILLPVTLLDQWAEEAKLWCPEWPIHKYYGSDMQRTQALRNLRRQGGLVLTSYQMLTTSDVLFDVATGGPDTVIKHLSRAASKGGRGSEGGRGRGRGRGRVSKASPDVEDATPEGGQAMDEEDAPQEDATSKQVAQPTKRRRLGSKRSEADILIPPELGEETSQAREAIEWDIVIGDEAHRMKNISTLLGKSLRKIRAKCRILLTGTPVQNALQDLWALLDFAQPGLLGNHATFVKHFSDPIDRGSVRGAGPFALSLKKHLAARLRSLIAPHLLRRTKVGTGLVEQSDQTAEDDWMLDEGLEGKQLPPKRDTIIWVIPTEEQILIYQKALERSDIIREATAKGKLGIEVFRAIGLLKRLCNHPLLGLPMPEQNSWSDLLGDALGSMTHIADEPKEEAMIPADAMADNILEGAGNAAAAAVADDARAGRQVEQMMRKLRRDADSLLAQSAKLRCMALLLPELAARGHRTLIFSQSVKMLDLVQVCVLKPNNLRCLRIDGKTDPLARAEKVSKFQRQRERFQCMLLTTNTGGVGLNLTGADRVVIVDPAWNPAADLQASDRAYRIGQDKEVKIYRLVTSGLIEDKMFRLQVFKMGLTNTALGNDSQHNYFTAKEIRALFEWVDPALGETRQKLLSQLGDAAAEHDASIKQSVDDDGGSTAGWMGDWMVAGASDYSAVMGGFRNEEEVKEEVELSVSAAQAKDKLNVAEETAQKAIMERLAVETRADAASQATADARAKIEECVQVRAKADEVLRERRAALSQTLQAEARAQKQLERASRARSSAQDLRIRKAHAQAQADADVGPANRAANDASDAVRTAEERLSAALDCIRSSLACCDTKTGKAKADASGKEGVVNMDPKKLAPVVKCLDQVQSAFDTAAIRQAELETVDEELASMVEADAAAAEPQANVAEPGEGEGGSSPSKEVSPRAARQAAKEAEALARQRAEERKVLELAQGTAQENAQAARTAAVNAVSALAEAGPPLVESFVKADGQMIRQEQVRSTQAAVRAAFKQLPSSLATLRRAQDHWSKATALRRKLTFRAKTASAARSEAQEVLTKAEREYSKAEEEEQALRKEHQAHSDAVAEAEAARHKAQMEEVEWRRKREELKVEAATVKETLKPARQAERAAAKARKEEEKSCANAEMKQTKMEMATENAIARLQSEVYDASQVEQAYATRRGRRSDTADSLG